MKISVIGCGTWGTCFAKICADAGNEVLAWTREAETVEEINSSHSNKSYLGSGFRLPESVRATRSPEDLAWGEVVVSALPCQALRSALPAFKDWTAGKPVVSLTKGMENGTAALPSQVIEECLGTDPGRVFALGGPNLAALLAKEEPAAAVVAGGSQEERGRLALAFSTPYFAVSPSGDLTGVQVWGALKNVAAIACGMAAGAGFGENTAAVLVAAALSEIEALAIKLGASAETMEGPAGVGDLVCTASSHLSRNFSLGYSMGLGVDVEAAARGIKGVTEGKDTITSALFLAEKYDSPMPLAQGIEKVMEGEGDFSSLFSNISKGRS